MGTIYLLRHAESELTVKRIFCGLLDPQLCEKGIETARRAGERLAHITFDRVVASPLQRCRMTARLVVGEDKEIAVDPALKEMDFGEWEGRSFAGLFETDPAKMEDYRREWPNYTFRGGDNVVEFFRRAGETLRRYLTDGYPGSTLLVSHAAFSGAAVGALTHGDPARLFEVEMKPCACLRLCYEEGKLTYEYV